jgi:ribose-phosphate pyrophosphokinase
MIIFGGSSSFELAEEVADICDCRLGEVTIKRFPDGERFVKIESDVKGEDAIVIQSTSPPQDENLIELFFICDALSDLGAAVTSVVPYYGYGRQDRAFQRGEAVASKTLAKLMGHSARKVITVNPHKEYILDYFDVPAVSLDASGLIGKYFQKKKLHEPVVVAPDAGSKDLSQRVADIIECRCENCEKKRIGPGHVITSAAEIELDGNDVIIVDDIIDSGGTIVESAKALKSQGAGNVYVACVHPVFTGNATERILKVADELVATNTIKTDFSKISIAPLIAESLE